MNRSAKEVHRDDDTQNRGRTANRNLVQDVRGGSWLVESAIGRPDMKESGKASNETTSFVELVSLVNKNVSQRGLMLFMKLDIGAVLPRKVVLPDRKLSALSSAIRPLGRSSASTAFRVFVLVGAAHDVDDGPSSSVAAEAAVSLRYVQKLFTERGTTCSEFIYSSRLDHAAHLLHRRAVAGYGRASQRDRLRLRFSRLCAFRAEIPQAVWLTPSAFKSGQGRHRF
jgi:AraC-like DNA-binding protein